jgi:catechol 2,3-dioxygenase-like lactoylglutathione lyase family enzyme
MSPIKKLGYVIVFVRDMQASTRFYRDAVGLALRAESEQWTEFELEGTTLALHLADGLPPRAAPLADPAAKRGASQELVFHSEDPLATRRELQQRGVIVAAPKLVHEAGPTLVGVSCLFEDPDGNLLSVYGIVPRSALG